MNVNVTLDPDADTNGTHLQDALDISYAELVEKLGEPNADSDGYKVDARWTVDTPAGVATIYNYKTGRNYLGSEGQNVEDIRDWHIGGLTYAVVQYIKDFLDG